MAAYTNVFIFLYASLGPGPRIKEILVSLPEGDKVPLNCLLLCPHRNARDIKWDFFLVSFSHKPPSNKKACIRVRVQAHV